MFGNFRRVAVKDIECLCASIAAGEPEAFHKFMYPEWYSEGNDDNPKDPELEIGRNFSALHFLTEGDYWNGQPPLYYIVGGGQPLDNQLQGEGHGRYFSPVQVQETAIFLSGLSKEELRTRLCDSAIIATRPPRVWDDVRMENVYTWLWENFVSVQNFFQQAAHHGNAVLFWVD